MFFLFFTDSVTVIVLSVLILGILAYLEPKLYFDSFLKYRMDINKTISRISFFVLAVISILFVLANGRAGGTTFTLYFLRMIIVLILYRKHFADQKNLSRATSAFIFTQIKLALILGAIDVIYVLYGVVQIGMN